MPIRLLPTLLLYILSVGYTPGPANIFSLSCSLRYGHRKSMRLWYGLLAGFTIAATTVVIICWAVGPAIADYVKWIKYIGAAYILYLAWTIFRSRGDIEPKGGECNFHTGMIVQLTNAKMIVFDFMAVGMFVMPYSHRLVDYLDFVFLLLLAGPGGNLAWIMAGGFLNRIFQRYRLQVDIVLSLLLVACAVIIVL